MPIKLEAKKKLSAPSERVKSVDLHPTEPWVVAALYNGNVLIWDYKTETCVKSFEVTELPIRCAKFVARKQWMICAADDMNIRVYNYNTMAKIKTFEAHTDYIRSLAIHPTQPFVLSSSDDMLIKLWNWDKNWQCTQVFEGHHHYVMMVMFNPKDPNTFASASLDRTIKVWNLSSPVPNYTLEGHERGVNCIDYFSGGDKPYLVSGGDDKTVKVWDYLNKSCVQTLEGHTHNVSGVSFHPTLPIIVSGSEDTTVRIWNANTYRLEKTLNYGMDRVWTLAILKGSNSVAVGYDEGTIMIKFGSEEPAISMDQNGKIIWAKQNDIQQVNIKATAQLVDGEKLTLPTKDLGTSEVFPQTLKHSANGRFVVVCGDGEFIIYTALAWRNKSFGKALEFVWGNETGEYAVRESTSKVKLFKNFKEGQTLRPNYSVEGIFGGRLLGLRSNSFLCFHDWAGDNQIIRRIDVNPKAVFWADSGELLVIACEASFYILRYNPQVVEQYAASGEPIPEDGIEDAFEVLHEINERIREAIWVEDCFIYTNANRLNYCVGSEVVTLAHLDSSMYPIGYMSKQSRIYLADKSHNLTSYSLELSMINYQTAILREDFECAAQLLPKIPKEQHNRIAQFLEKQGHKEMAMNIATDMDLKFDLAVQLKKLGTAYQLAKQADSEPKWKQLSDVALACGEVQLTRECLINAQDFGSLLLVSTAIGDVDALNRIAAKTREDGLYNISFLCYFLLNQMDNCLSLLCEAGRIPEAAFLARTYKPSKVSDIVALWREDLKKVNAKAAESLADPAEYPNLFPDMEWALKAEQALQSTKLKPASAYLSSIEDRARDIIQELKEGRFTLPEETSESFEQQPAEPTTFKEPEVEEPTTTAATTTESTPSPAEEEKDGDDLDLDDIIGGEDVDDVELGDLDLEIDELGDL